MQQVHLRIIDAASGKPTHVRLRCTDADGRYYAPFGRLTHFRDYWTPDCAGNVIADGRECAYVDGACEINLPIGPITIEVAKGPEYRPLRQELTLNQGKLALRLVIERWINLRSEGWYSGDVGAHALTPHGALLEAAGEDLAVVNLLAEWTLDTLDDHPEALLFSMPNLLAFSGQQPCLSLPDHLVVVNTRNHHQELGRLDLLNCHRVVHPLAFGGLLGSDNWTLSDWCGQCHRKAGLVIWSDLAEWSLDTQAAPETLANAINGDVDAVGLDLQQPEPWYALLNCGLRLPLLCGRDRDFVDVPLGQVRTYARLQPGEAFTYKNWIEAVRAGRTFATKGPLLELHVNGAELGGVVDLDEPGQPVRVNATCRSIDEKAWLELVHNGEVLASGFEQMSQPLGLPGGGWLALRCWRQGLLLAHTSPIYISVPSQPPRPNPRVVQSIAAQLDRRIAWVKTEARCPDEAHRARFFGIFDRARATLLKLMH